MQKYSPISDDTPNMREDSEHVSFYWCADVEAQIDALRGALKSCAVVMVHHMEASDRFAKLAREALNEVDKALSV
jgi:DNA-binding FrmR family transcriptional regulator